jgi:NADH:ubiquinone oxidoreductase subunit K
MSVESLHIFWQYLLFTVMLSVIGIYCVLMTYNLIRALIGLEILIKAVTLLIIVGGYASDHVALAQGLVISLIVVEVVVIAVSVGVVLCIYRKNNSLDARALRGLKD